MGKYNLNELQKHDVNNRDYSEVRLGDKKFLTQNALVYVEDDVYEGSVELSHYDSLGYKEVIDFDMPAAENVLDLTWMRSCDKFAFVNSDSFDQIDEIIVNIDNLEGSHLPFKLDDSQKFDFIFNGKSSNKIFISQVVAFSRFARRENIRIKTIDFIGFNPIIESILRKIVNSSCEFKNMKSGNMKNISK